MKNNKPSITTNLSHHSYNFENLRFEHTLRSGNNIYSHWHEFYEISLVISNGESIITNNAVSFTDAAVIFCTPTDIHSITYTTDKAEQYIISFSANIISTEKIRYLLANSKGFTIPVSGDELSFWIKVFQDFEYNYFKSSEFHKLYVSNIVEYILLHIFDTKKHIQNKPSINSNPILSIIEYIQIHFTDNITLAEIADTVHLSETYTSYLFRKETGKSICQHITELRLEKAAHLLTYTTNSITDIAHFAGFNTSKHFQRCFKNTYGMTPSEYRKKLCKTHT